MVALSIIGAHDRKKINEVIIQYKKNISGSQPTNGLPNNTVVFSAHKNGIRASQKITPISSKVQFTYNYSVVFNPRECKKSINFSLLFSLKDIYKGQKDKSVADKPVSSLLL